MPRPLSQQLSGSGITVEPDLLVQVQRSSELEMAGYSCRRSTCQRRQLISAKWMEASVMPVGGLRLLHSTFQPCEQQQLIHRCDEPEVLCFPETAQDPWLRHHVRRHPSVVCFRFPLRMEQFHLHLPSHVQHQSYHHACRGAARDPCLAPDRGVSHDHVRVRLRSSFAQTYRQLQVSVFLKESSPRMSWTHTTSRRKDHSSLSHSTLRMIRNQPSSNRQMDNIRPNSSQPNTLEPDRPRRNHSLENIPRPTSRRTATDSRHSPEPQHQAHRLRTKLLAQEIS